MRLLHIIVTTDSDHLWCTVGLPCNTFNHLSFLPQRTSKLGLHTYQKYLAYAAMKAALKWYSLCPHTEIHHFSITQYRLLTIVQIPCLLVLFPWCAAYSLVHACIYAEIQLANFVKTGLKYKFRDFFFSHELCPYITRFWLERQYQWYDAVSRKVDIHSCKLCCVAFEKQAIS